jgi:hypothetical protein
MARILAAFPSSLIAAREGMSANAFYKQLQSLGMGARRSEVLALYKISKNIVARAGEEPFRDITQVPSGDEIRPWPVKKATGFIQTVSLVLRDRTTGTLSHEYYSVKYDQPIVREQVMAMAADAYSTPHPGSDRTLMGIVHTGTRHLQRWIGR